MKEIRATLTEKLGCDFEKNGLGLVDKINSISQQCDIQNALNDGFKLGVVISNLGISSESMFI